MIVQAVYIITTGLESVNILIQEPNDRPNGSANIIKKKTIFTFNVLTGVSRKNDVFCYMNLEVC
jgi:hypothetical protein